MIGTMNFNSNIATKVEMGILVHRMKLKGVETRVCLFFFGNGKTFNLS